MNMISALLRLRRNDLHVDPAKPVSCQVVGDRRRVLQLAFTEHDSGTNLTLRIQLSQWRGLAKVIGQQLAFIELQERRESELADKMTADEVVVRHEASTLWSDWDRFCELHGFKGPLDTPDTLAVTRDLQAHHYEFLDSWHARRVQLMHSLGT